MKNKINILIVIFFSLISYKANSQEIVRRDLKEIKSKMLERMRVKLNLSDEQVAKIKLIDAKYINEQEDARNKASALRSEIKLLKEREKNEIDKILTLEQIKKLEMLKQEQQNKIKKRMNDNSVLDR